ncbi:hypothetical protein GCM10029963_53020 [Micromonospora andamanensis]|uniref:hypothetical protein n=1 Tax=Micromonospora andamanensis TaxID=1287068 RepID=UPI0019501544|nr:hypothetical protein [Micromonospora andamanensis]GIJ42633.1 hypothetical protein Vwe01_59580 [Micromonospora andamanensis]
MGERLHGVEIVVDAPRRSLQPQQYMKVLTETRLALQEVDKAALPGRLPRLEWVIEDISVNGVHRAVIVPQRIPVKRTVLTVTGTTVGLVRGVESLRQKAEIPPLFSVATVGRLPAMATIGDQIRAVHIRATDDDKVATVDEAAVEHAKRATQVGRRTFGSVEGRLEVLSRSRAGIRVLVVNERTRRAVTVRAADDAREQLRVAWGERVRVAGELVRNPAGQPIRLDMTEMRVLPELKRVSAWDILGVAPDYTGDLTTEEFIRHARRG